MAMTGPFSGWMRNYEAMGDSKLMAALRDLKSNSGDAYNRVVNRDGLLYEHLREASAVAKSRGLGGADVDPNADARSMGVLTDPMECAECGRVERHYEDDYVCRACRDAM